MRLLMFVATAASNSHFQNEDTIAVTVGMFSVESKLTTNNCLFCIERGLLLHSNLSSAELCIVFTFYYSYSKSLDDLVHFVLGELYFRFH